jgi:tRNA(Ile)-lysidine synthase
MAIDLNSFLKQHVDAAATTTFFLAVSGGVDSMILLHKFHALNLKCVVLHVNYQLREEDSNLDQKLVESTCIAMNIPCKILVVDKLHIKNREKGNLQEIARRLRYDFFAREMANSSNAKLVLGHHKNDQAETFLMHLDRKAGIMGLACMAPSHANILRPLLNYSKQELYAEANRLQVKWREDGSNSRTNYYRNFIRQNIIPVWEEKSHNLIDHLAENVLYFQTLQKELEVRIALILAKGKTVSIETWGKMLSVEKAEVLRQWNFPAQMVNEVTDLLNCQVGKYVTGNGLSVFRERDFLILADQRNETLPSFNVESVNSFEKGNLNFAYLDASRINGELRLRKWKTGDRMTPLGMKGSKLISTILANEKVLSSQKKNFLVLEDDKIIHWLVGVRVSDYSKITNKTIDIQKVSLD